MIQIKKQTGEQTFYCLWSYHKTDIVIVKIGCDVTIMNEDINSKSIFLK